MSNELPSRVRWLVESSFALDGGAMFGIIPKPLWTRRTESDDRNRISLACRCLLVSYDDGRHVLVDTGMGTKWDERSRDIYRIDNQDEALERALGNVGLSQYDITDVVLTHLHLDHAGGLCRYEEDRVVANFPNATHWVQSENWSWANAPSDRDAGSYRKIDFSFLETADAPTLELVNGDQTLFPGFEVRQMNGHTFGMQICVVTDQHGETYAHLADLIPTSAHLDFPYIMGYDLQPLVTLQEKQELLHEAADAGWHLVFEHDPIVGSAQIEFANGRPRVAQ